MSNIPRQLKYSATHEWAFSEEANIITVGITDHAQDLLGDVVYVELPVAGQKVTKGAECAVVESVKAASDIYSPVSGEIVEVNEALQETPSLINEAPYVKGWIFRVKVASSEEYDQLLDASSYRQQISEHS